jgi:transcriptional regulator with AAA-type ATPase domain
VQCSRPVVPFTPNLIEACLHHPWPGNVGELENFVKRYLLTGDESQALRALTGSPAPQPRPTLRGCGPNQFENGQEQERNLKFLVPNLKVEAEIQAITRP